jgi:TonB family protein
MNAWAVFLALCLVPVGVPLMARAASCPSTPAKPAEQPRIELPQETKITSKVIEFEADIGSDGRVRGLRLEHSSGDGAVDLSTQQTLQPAQTGCVAFSSTIALDFSLPGDNLAEPTPPAKLDPTCTPYIVSFITPNPRDRKRTGTATIAVELDAAGTERAAPVLRQSTGSPVLDAEALRIAKTGQYDFFRPSSCTPQPFTYELELTFQ